MTMNYTFTAILIIAMCLMALFMEPAYPRNDYLNSFSGECKYGSVDLSISQGSRDSNNYSSSPYSNEEKDNRISLSFRKDLGVSKKQCDQKNAIVLQNEKLKQQLELYKKCGSINRNSTLQYNNNFNELVIYCKGIGGTENNKPSDSNSYWDVIKNDYKKENPDVNLMGDKILLPPKDYKMPVPEWVEV